MLAAKLGLLIPRRINLLVFNRVRVMLLRIYWVFVNWQIWLIKFVHTDKISVIRFLVYNCRLETYNAEFFPATANFAFAILTRFLDALIAKA